MTERNPRNPRAPQNPPQNPYASYRFESFDNDRARRGSFLGGIKDSVAGKLSNPTIAGSALVITILALAGIIFISYPGDSNRPVPVITADATPYKSVPDEPGGMDIAHEDSTIFSTIRAAGLEESAPVENLLDQEEPIDKLEAFSKQADALFEKDKAAQQQAAQTADAAQAPGLVDIPPGEEESAAAATEIAPAAGNAKTASSESEDPLEFVRDVLDKKDAQGSAPKTQAINTQADKTSTAPDKIEPAAGTAQPVAKTALKAIAPGSHFAQLASIPSREAAGTEWKKLQKTFPILGSADYRVQKADLGAKGTFYRIQAGPMSKDSAASVCTAVKAQRPGGCLIVQ